MRSSAQQYTRMFRSVRVLWFVGALTDLERERAYKRLYKLVFKEGLAVVRAKHGGSDVVKVISL